MAFAFEMKNDFDLSVLRTQMTLTDVFLIEKSSFLHLWRLKFPNGILRHKIPIGFYNYSFGHRDQHRLWNVSVLSGGATVLHVYIPTCVFSNNSNVISSAYIGVSIMAVSSIEAFSVSSLAVFTHNWWILILNSAFNACAWEKWSSDMLVSPDKLFGLNWQFLKKLFLNNLL